MQLEQLFEVLARIERRIDSLESRVEQITAPPKAMSVADAAQFMGYEETAFRELIRRGYVRTFRIAPDSHPRVAMSELVRLTSFSTPPTGGRPPPRPRGTKHGRSEAEEIRALAKKKN